MRFFTILFRIFLSLAFCRFSKADLHFSLIHINYTKFHKINQFLTTQQIHVLTTLDKYAIIVVDGRNERRTMSYSFNIPNSRPMIQESQSMKNNGGGGNTGYFQRGRKKKEDEKNTPMFSEKDDTDSFVLETNDKEKMQPKSEKLLKTILNKAKDMLKQPEKPSNNPFASGSEM